MPMPHCSLGLCLSPEGRAAEVYTGSLGAATTEAVALVSGNRILSISCSEPDLELTPTVYDAI